MEFSKKFKSLQFSMVQGSLNPNITVLDEKLSLSRIYLAAVIGLNTTDTNRFVPTR